MDNDDGDMPNLQATPKAKWQQHEDKARKIHRSDVLTELEQWLNDAPQAAFSDLVGSSLRQWIFRKRVELLGCLMICLMPAQDRQGELLKAASPEPAQTRPAWSQDGHSGGRRMTWLDGVVELGRSRNVDVIADPQAIERLLR